MSTLSRSLFALMLCAALAGCASDAAKDDADTGGTDVALDGGADGDAGTDAALDTTIDTGTDVAADTATDTIEPPAECGDGVLDSDEECDEGPSNSDDNADACRENCQLPSCGDGVVDSEEECDDGNDSDTDFCTNACVRVATDLCDECEEDADCGGADDACVALPDGNRCGLSCRADRDCPDGFLCDDVTTAAGAPVRHCVPASGVCVDCFDPDRDGFGTGAGCEAPDCDQTNSAVFPGADEICNGEDDNCNGDVDEGLGGISAYPDGDGDGFGDDSVAAREVCALPDGFVENADDCDDENGLVYTGAPEVCDEEDNDCNGEVDDGTSEQDFYVDGDGDGFGDEDGDATSACEPPEGQVTNNRDCDDGNGLVSPSAGESCGNGIDDDCDGDLDCDDSDCAETTACITGCEDDRLEDNDARGDALPIAAGTFENLVSCEGDDDWYAIELPAGATVTAALAFSDAEGDVDLSLVDEDGRVVAASVTVTDDEEIDVEIATAGTYFLRVYLFADAGAPGNAYTLTVAVEEGEVTCRDDAFEDNDFRDDAADLPGGTTAELVACPGDRDVYAVVLGVEDELSVDVTFSHDAGDIDLRLLDDTGRVVASSETADDTESIDFTAPRSGRFFVEVQLFLDDETPGNGYSMTTSRTEADPCDADVFENNDTAGTARAIEPGDYDNLRVCGGDDDYYAFDLPAGAEFDASIDFGFFDGDIDLYLYNPAGAVVASSTATFRSSESIAYTTLTSGRFLLYVTQAIDLFGESTDYSMSVSIVLPPPTCDDDRFEDNDDRDDATDLALGATSDVQACPGDDDYFAFALGTGDVVTLTASFTDAVGDIDLVLQNAAGATVASSVSVTDDESITYTATETGTFYARVYLFGTPDPEGNTYDLDLDIVAADPCAGDDDFEPNDTRESAFAVGSEFVEDGLQVCAEDEDWFAIALGAGDSLSVDALFTDADGDIDIQVRNAAGDAVAGSASVTDDESLTFTASVGGLYYVRVYLWSGDINTYDLLIERTAATPTCPADDRFEDNDSEATAVTITPGSYDALIACGAQFDDDYFEISLPSGGDLTIDVTFLHADGDIDLYLLDDALDEVGGSDSVDDNEQVIATDLAPGLYVIAVENLDTTPVPYSLDIVLGDL